jgi:hypothetical protein
LVGAADLIMQTWSTVKKFSCLTQRLLIAPLTVVLVHGAFADGSSWTGVIGRLLAHGRCEPPR